MKRILPGLTGSEHGIEDRQKLAHAGDDGKLFRFAGGDEAVVELLDSNRSHPPALLPPAPWQGVDSSSTTVLVARGT